MDARNVQKYQSRARINISQHKAKRKGFQMTHSGAEWIKESFKVNNMSPLGEAVANLLGDCWSGIYHLETKDLKAVDWSSDHHIEFVLRYKSLATFDSDDLTRFVILCHDYALRGSIDARANHQLRLMFHQRKRDGGVWERHPTIEQALELWRKYHPVEIESVLNASI